MAALFGALVLRASPADEEDMCPAVWVVCRVGPCRALIAVQRGVVGLVVGVNGLVLLAVAMPLDGPLWPWLTTSPSFASLPCLHGSGSAKLCHHC